MNEHQDRDQIILAITGASGVQYGLRLLQQLLAHDRTVYLMISAAAQVVIQAETTLRLPRDNSDATATLLAEYGGRPGQLQLLARDQWMSPVASGSHRARAMVICPCSSGSLAAIAAGASDNLIERAADVMLKEQRKLILVHREMPVSAIHLENMLRLARLNAVIMPASPGFYHKPEGVADMIDFVVARILDHLDIDHALVPRWGADS